MGKFTTNETINSVKSLIKGVWLLVLIAPLISLTMKAQVTVLSENFDNTANWHSGQWTVAPGWADINVSGTQWSVSNMSGYSRSGAQYVYAQFSSNAYIITPSLSLSAWCSVHPFLLVQKL